MLDHSLVEARQLGISCLTAIGIGIGFRLIGTRALSKDKEGVEMEIEMPLFNPSNFNS